LWLVGFNTLGVSDVAVAVTFEFGDDFASMPADSWLKQSCYTKSK
jgi:hypothetical protein